MENEELRVLFWEKIKETDRSFAWFHRNYLGESKLAYNTLYKQSVGKELKVMSNFLVSAMEKFIQEYKIQN